MKTQQQVNPGTAVLVLIGLFVVLWAFFKVTETPQEREDERVRQRINEIKREARDIGR